MFDIGDVTEASIHYVSGYVMTKQFSPNDDWCERSFALMSRRPGIGFAHLEQIAGNYTENPRSFMTLKGGYKVGLPRVLYRDWETDRKSTRLNSSHSAKSRMPSSA